MLRFFFICLLSGKVQISTSIRQSGKVRNLQRSTENIRKLEQISDPDHTTLLGNKTAANNAILKISHVVKVKNKLGSTRNTAKKQENEFWDSFFGHFRSKEQVHAGKEKLAYDRKLAYEDYYDSITGAKFLEDDYIDKDFDEAQVISEKPSKPRNNFLLHISNFMTGYSFVTVTFLSIGLMALALDKLKDNDEAALLP